VEGFVRAVNGTVKMNPSYLDQWTPEQFEVLEQSILVARHRIHSTGLFSDDALADLIDKHPSNYLTIAAMGRDQNKFEWMVGDRNGLSARELLSAVRNGKLWLNVIAITRFHEEYKKLIDSVYNELEANNPRFQAKNRSGNILISSPNAMVYYHIDLPVNMLWHLRGEKRVWVYPPFDPRFVSSRNIERLIAGEMAEDMPYHAWFEDYALSFDVKPGDLITWPQNTPHRVTNLDGLNVSLSTEHRNARAQRRLNVHRANRLLRQRFGYDSRNTSPDGISARTKEAAIRGLTLWNRLTKKKVKEPFGYRKRFIVDPAAENGYRLLDGESAANFEEENAVLMGR